MTLDGFCDHTAITPDEEIHQYYADLLRKADTILFGRVTYQLMQYWKTVVDNPTGNQSMDEFAMVIGQIPKIVFSHSLKDTGWETAKLSSRTIEEEILDLRQQPGSQVLIGSRSLIIQLMKLNLIDEYRICVHPVIAGGGLPLFENVNNRASLTLVKTKTFGSGAIVLYYKPNNEE